MKEANLALQFTGAGAFGSSPRVNCVGKFVQGTIRCVHVGYTFCDDHSGSKELGEQLLLSDVFRPRDPLVSMSAALIFSKVLEKCPSAGTSHEIVCCVTFMKNGRYPSET